MIMLEACARCDRPLNTIKRQIKGLCRSCEKELKQARPDIWQLALQRTGGLK